MITVNIGRIYKVPQVFAIIIFFTKDLETCFNLYVHMYFTTSGTWNLYLIVQCRYHNNFAKVIVVRGSVFFLVFCLRGFA